MVNTLMKAYAEWIDAGMPMRQDALRGEGHDDSDGVAKGDDSQG